MAIPILSVDVFLTAEKVCGGLVPSLTVYTGLSGLSLSGVNATLYPQSALKAWEDEIIMGLDMIVVLCLALIFFGGISWLAWKDRAGQKPEATEAPASPQESRKPTVKSGKK